MGDPFTEALAQNVTTISHLQHQLTEGFLPKTPGHFIISPQDSRAEGTTFTLDLRKGSTERLSSLSVSHSQ
jgi:hypothetical protein